MKKGMSFMRTLCTTAAEGAAVGRFEVYDLGTFRLHVYYTNDALDDACFIIEGRDALVTLEPPLFKVNVAEYDAYLAGLGKPVGRSISNYHAGGDETHATVMPEGMPAFIEGPVYGGMMQEFARAFGDAIVEAGPGAVSEVAFGSTHTWAGVDFEFRRGATSDFPAASILIGGKVYYTHWTPVKAHMSHLQLVSAAAVAAELAEARQSLASGAELFIGGHGGAATREAVEFKAAYLERMERLLSENGTPGEFVDAMRQSWPDLPGAEGLEALAGVLYGTK